MNTKKSPAFPWILIGLLAVLYLLSLGWFMYHNIQESDTQVWELIVNGILLSVPLLLFYYCIGVVIVAVRQKAHQGQIDGNLARTIYWAPRIGAILIILFVSMFSLDVFEGNAPLGEKLLGFLMHSLPSIAMTIVLVLAWRWEWVGFVAFLLAGAFFLRTMLFDLAQGLGMFLIFTGPMLLIALLFGINWWWRKDLRPQPQPKDAL